MNKDSILYQNFTKHLNNENYFSLLLRKKDIYKYLAGVILTIRINRDIFVTTYRKIIANRWRRETS